MYVKQAHHKHQKLKPAISAIICLGIIAVTESRFNEHYLESEVHIHGYTHYRSDQKAATRKGGIID